MSTTIVRRNPNPGGKWWLVALLVLVIIVILAIAFFATHPHVFGSSATATPTATATSTPTAGPTGTPVPGPTGTPVPGASSASPTPKAVATGTPTVGAAGTPTTPTTSAVKTGVITHTQSQIRAIQQGANRGQSQDTLYLDPVQVVQHNLGAYGFSQPVTIISPSPSATATLTPTTNSQGLPMVHVVVKYQGTVFTIYLDQPVQQGPKGIWVIITIRACASGQTSC